MSKSRIVQALSRATRTVSKEEFARKVRRYEGYDPGFSDSNPTNREKWIPAKKAGHVPTPRLLKPGIKKVHPQWEDYLTPENEGQDWVILGLGASSFKVARELDDQLVYGINRTLMWFKPTFLQFVDAPVYHDQVESPRYTQAERETQLVTSKWMKKARVSEPLAEECLDFRLIHPGLDRKANELTFAEDVSEEVMWAPNSLAFALQVVHWFKPRRVALVGMDWGGPHIFGDGRYKGSSCNYGVKGDLKEGLIGKIAYLAEQLKERGTVVRHVGENKLNLFDQVDSIKEAFK